MDSMIAKYSLAWLSPAIADLVEPGSHTEILFYSSTRVCIELSKNEKHVMVHKM